MIVVSLRFPAGRVHATPWGRQVNEGVVEWPPSPWRIARALIATWYHKAQDEVTPSALRTLISKLTDDSPAFYLPPATVSHTRHFMPYIEGKKEKRTKIFDTFVHVMDGGPLEIIWAQAELNDAEAKAMDILLKRLGYFGRAESLVEARLETEPVCVPNSYPLTNQRLPSTAQELVQVMAPMPAVTYLAWRDGYAAALAAKLSQTAGRARGKSKAVTQVLPADILAALLADTGDLKRSGWSQPPGAYLLNYARPRDVFEVRITAKVRKRSGPLPTIARYAVASQVIPRLTQAVSVAERIHQSLVKFSDNAPVFTGLDSEGKPLRVHEHTRILCETNDDRGSIASIILSAAMGFDEHARRALDQLRRVWGHGGHDLQLVLLGVGQSKDFGGLDTSRDQSPILAESAEWRSLTPFVPTRHPKAYRDGRPKCDEYGVQIGSPEHDLLRLITESGLPRPIRIERMKAGRLGNRSVPWLAFQRQRKHGEGAHAGLMGYGFAIVFPKAVWGPLAFGYASHFGLGLFGPGFMLTPIAGLETSVTSVRK
jgi:CRISPR-associated protein Csb2